VNPLACTPGEEKDDRAVQHRTQRGALIRYPAIPADAGTKANSQTAAQSDVAIQRLHILIGGVIRITQVIERNDKDLPLTHQFDGIAQRATALVTILDLFELGPLAMCTAGETMALDHLGAGGWVGWHGAIKIAERRKDFLATEILIAH